MNIKPKFSYTITPSSTSERSNTVPALRKATAYLQNGNLEGARQTALQILRGHPQHFEALHLLGVIAVRAQRPAEAIELITKALELKRDASAYVNRAAARNMLRHCTKALADCDLALTINPGLAIAHCVRGNALKGLNRGSEACASFDQAIALSPEFAEAWLSRGNACMALGHTQNALASYDRAIELQPDHAMTHANRGVALSMLRRTDEALASYDRAVALQPDYAEAWINRGVALNELGRPEEAIASFERAIGVEPDNHRARINLSQCNLLTGNFRNGWEDHESRWALRAATFVPPPGSGQTLLTPTNFGKPVWDGVPSKGTLLVWCEQGLGEQIMYASMFAEVQKRVGKLILALEPRLHALFARSFPKCEITTIEAAGKEQRFDFQIPMGSLGRHFRNSPEDFLRNRKAFLAADKKRGAALRKTIAPASQRICGLSWNGKRPEFGPAKSIPLASLRALLEIPDLRCVDLQYGDTTTMRAALKQDCGTDLIHIDSIDNLNDLDGLAALINACDTVVTVSNVTAHLAGALGKEVWLMLPHATGWLWYWQTGRDDALWYPNVHVLRPRIPGDWCELIEHLCRALAGKARNTRAPVKAVTAEKPPAAKKKASAKQSPTVKKAGAAKKPAVAKMKTKARRSRQSAP